MGVPFDGTPKTFFFRNNEKTLRELYLVRFLHCKKMAHTVPGFFFVPFELNNARFNEAQIESEVAKTLVYCKSSFFRQSPL